MFGAHQQDASQGAAYAYDISCALGGSPTDFNGDGMVGGADLALLRGAWGP